MTDSFVPFKKPNTKTPYTIHEISELARCSVDPVYFIENYIKVQHPTKGAIKFYPYLYQSTMISSMHNYKDTVILAGRQLGKCVTHDCKISIISKYVKIGDLLWKHLTQKEKIITTLQNLIIRFKIWQIKN